MPLSDDESRLVRFFRCLSSDGRNKALQDIGHDAIERCFGGEWSAFDTMPMAGGVESEKLDGSVYDPIMVSGTIVEILRDGIEAAGGSEALLGTSDFDEEEAIPYFAAGASATASRQGSYYHYDENFAREYIPAWRWEIVSACEAAAAARDKHADEDRGSDC